MEPDGSDTSVSLRLCESCQQLDLIRTFQPEYGNIPYTGKPILQLGKYPSDVARVKCPLCRFFFTVCRSWRGKRDQLLYVRLFDQIKSRNGASSTHIPRTPFWSVLSDYSPRMDDSDIRDGTAMNGIIAYQTASSTVPCTVLALDATNIDYDLLGSWLTHCQTSHDACMKVESGQSSLQYLNLIDCVQETVVQAKPDQQYLTLSYVWGHANSTSEPQPGGESRISQGVFSFAELPPTIYDAICVVRKLGMRYLWVDRYCINHEDCAEETVMIRSMGQIYANAQATIVALYGWDDGAGLPGVSKTPRTPQPHFVLGTGDGCLISSFPRLPNMIADSQWNTRGWTYQEARLSRRCFFFTEYQVYFVCQESSQSEAVPSDPGTNSISSLLNNNRLNASLFGYNVVAAEGLYLDRMMFSQRRLTYESDVLDAFRGLLARSPFITFWGVPVIPAGSQMDPSLGLALGFLRVRGLADHRDSCCVDPGIRRLGFPTWSWASITGDISNDRYLTNSVCRHYLEGDPKVLAQNDAYLQFWKVSRGQQVPLHEIIQQLKSNAVPEDSHCLAVEGDLVRVKLKSTSLGFQHCEQNDKEMGFFGGAHLDLVPPLTPSKSNISCTSHMADPEGSGSMEDALILIEWCDSQETNERRMTMMLLTWVTKDVAERRGLLYSYVDAPAAESYKAIPRTRRKFLLQ
jgi:Heterokaryon incompatibility protein (HET)